MTWKAGKKTLTTEQERIWALLEKADTLEAVIALEERLSEIRYQLESMESQLKLYDNHGGLQHPYPSHISEVAVYTPTGSQSVGARIQDGFKRNLTSVKNNSRGPVRPGRLYSSHLVSGDPGVCRGSRRDPVLYRKKLFWGEGKKRTKNQRKSWMISALVELLQAALRILPPIKKHGAAKGNFDPLQRLSFY